MTDQQIIKELCKFDTPSITNVVATYPGNPFCLGLYNPWTENWYTDDSLRCMYPELGALCGYAVTGVYGLPDPNGTTIPFSAVLEALDESPRPTIFVFQQKFPPEIARKVGLAGGNMTTAMKALGCVGAISNGPSRDIDEIRPMKFQYLISGATPGHGAQGLHSVNAPVSVAGMDVAPGEIIHMDENGACKFPANRLADVYEKVKALAEHEAQSMGRVSKARSAAEIRAIMAGDQYGDKKPAKKAKKSAKK